MKYGYDLTVLISTYDPKRKELLNKAIRSIKNQTLKTQRGNNC